MQTFDDVLSELVALLRRSDAGGFVPRGAAKPNPKTKLKPRPITLRRAPVPKPAMPKPAMPQPAVPKPAASESAVSEPTASESAVSEPTASESAVSEHRGTALVSYRDVYRCPASTWGRGGFVPEAQASCASDPGPARQSVATPRAASPKQSVRMPFRIFDEP